MVCGRKISGLCEPDFKKDAPESLKTSSVTTVTVTARDALRCPCVLLSIFCLQGCRVATIVGRGCANVKSGYD